ncbi:nitroreductase family protein [Woodsholea maritima]|uniref:nitroreductase family protein n=1 Tax=Woodsholea maritima TaxID=240237 RepID=UPI00037B26F2|nr:nitroreductase family protein [Woodsholea maritima]
MTRSPDYPIDPMFTQRWSPRAFDGQAMDDHDLKTIMEAARWAPSCYNYQPWRFIFIHREDARWDASIGVLDAFNQQWAKHASALIFVVSDTLMGPSEDRLAPSHFHSFDAGAAWAHMSLQANRIGYHMRAMAGVDYARAPEVLRLPTRFKLQIAVAVGRQTTPEHLPDMMQKDEVLTPRRPLQDTIFEGVFAVTEN